MSDWKQAQKDKSEALARLHFFTVKKKHSSGDLDVRITIQKFATPEIGALELFATADIELNQKIATFQPVGWSNTLLGALGECLKNLRRFEYEGRSYPQPVFSRAIRTTRASTSGATAGRPGYCRCLEPSNFLATSLRYQAKMVSGWATQATARSALRPRRFPISARVARSGSLNRNLDGSFALRIRFSAARYSFCSRSSWLTEPVTYASSRTHFLFLMPTAYLTLRRAV